MNIFSVIYILLTTLYLINLAKYNYNTIVFAFASFILLYHLYSDLNTILAFTLVITLFFNLLDKIVEGNTGSKDELQTRLDDLNILISKESRTRSELEDRLETLRGWPSWKRKRTRKINNVKKRIGYIDEAADIEEELNTIYLEEAAAAERERLAQEAAAAAEAERIAIEAAAAAAEAERLAEQTRLSNIADGYAETANNSISGLSELFGALNNSPLSDTTTIPPVIQDDEVDALNNILTIKDTTLTDIDNAYSSACNRTDDSRTTNCNLWYNLKTTWNDKTTEVQDRLNVILESQGEEIQRLNDRAYSINQSVNIHISDHN